MSIHAVFDPARISFCCRLAAMMLTLAVWVGVSVSRAPASLIAGDAASMDVAKILAQADRDIRTYHWRDALHVLEKVQGVCNRTEKKAVSERIRWCAVNAALEERYDSENLADYFRSVAPEEALDQLRDVLRLIDKNYYTRIDKQKCLSKALLQLLAVTENPNVLAQYGAVADELGALRRSIEQARAQVAAATAYDNQYILNVAALLNQAYRPTGFGDAWPVLELAYAYADSLDGYSHLLGPKEYQSLKERMQGFYVGIGIDLVVVDSYPTVFDVVHQSPAYLGGIRPGDTLLAVDGVDLQDMTVGQIGKLISGPAESEVAITLTRTEETLTCSVHRRLIHAPSVRNAHVVDSDGHIGYLRVTMFDQDTAMEMRRAIERLVQAGARSLMVDLRCNGGGIMKSGIEAARVFLERGAIVTVNSSRKRRTFRADGLGPAPYRLPVVLLVDENTASAAEIFAAALQDNRRATIIGQQTLGKGLVQSIYHLNESSLALCLTTASYLPPGRISFHLRGITPNISITPAQKPVKKTVSSACFVSHDDPVLQQALRWLN